MIIRHTLLDPSYWKINGGSLQNNTVFNQNVPTWILDPVTLTDTLGGTKTSKFTPDTITSYFKTTLTNNISIPNAANFTAAAFNSRGWSTGDKATLIIELATFFGHNINNTTINPGFDGINMILTIGKVGVTDCIIPFGYLGDKGIIDSVLDDIYGDMLFTENVYEYYYGGSLFTDNTFNLVINGGPW